MPKRDERTSIEIDLLAQEGNILLDNENDADGAIVKWTKALALLPSPTESNPEALWLHASIGEALLSMNKPRDAQIAFKDAYRSPDGHVNPLVLLRLGELHMPDPDPRQASQYLLRAYMLEGQDIFEDSPQAFAFLQKHQNLSKS